MRIAVLGGGPGGLYFAALAKQLDPRHEVHLWERNAPGDTFGFGVVFSDETLGGIEHADAAVFAAMERDFARWDDIDVHYHGTVLTSGGHGFAAMSRHRLLAILQQRCAELGVRSEFSTPAPDATALARRLRPRRCRRRGQLADQGAAGRRPRAGPGDPALRLHLARHRPGLRRVQVLHPGHPGRGDADPRLPLQPGREHVHPGGPRRRVAPRRVRRAWPRPPPGLPPGRSDEASIEIIRGLCADVLGGAAGSGLALGGHGIAGNNSRWVNFTTVRCARWHHGNVVLIGDAAHTAHFSIGSGTKLAMEDALALAACLHEQPDVTSALDAYEAERRPVVASTQRAAQASLEWFEHIGSYTGQEPEQFAFNIITRSRRVTYDNLRLRDPEFVAGMDRWFAGQQDAGEDGTGPDVRPPMFQPGRIGGLHLKNRVIVSPMDMYSARDGLPGDFHLVHLGSKALGGAGLVMTEMVCVSADRADQPRLRGPVHRGPGGRVAAGGGLRARPRSRRGDRDPARPLGPQGVHPADVGGHRPAAGARATGRCAARPRSPTRRPARCRAS